MTESVQQTTYEFHIEHSSLPIKNTKKFPSDLTVEQLKQRLERIVGTTPKNMIISVRDYQTQSNLFKIDENTDSSTQITELFSPHQKLSSNSSFILLISDKDNSSSNLFQPTSVQMEKKQEHKPSSDLLAWKKACQEKQKQQKSESSQPKNTEDPVVEITEI
eukprot:TRINITY_DN7720_c0_g1_i1.p1 TRINITY_DN7720_c0_g1~~TRINITY_DN7720_c0_g1_i1.p1  ORF type:complete len:171 (+),score=49.13 TRINITY_DN7720_c0_g1_i1:28-513(+)